MKKIMFILGFILITTSCYSEVQFTYSDTGFKYQLTSFHDYEINPELYKKSYRDPWNTQDTILELSFLIIAGIDLWQTYTFLYRQEHGVESLEILGEKPSKTKLFITAGLWGIGHCGISYVLPKRYLRNTWQMIGIVAHFNAVGKNYSLGIRIPLN